MSGAEILSRLKAAECRTGCNTHEFCACATMLDAAEEIETITAERDAAIAERDEALRRRDAWKARAEHHVEIVDALNAKTAGLDSRSLGRALLGAAKMNAEAERDALRAEVERLRYPVDIGRVWGAIRSGLTMNSEKIHRALNGGDVSYEMESAILDSVARDITDRVEFAAIYDTTEGRATQEGDANG